jgi:hypothetical protein
VGGTGYFHALYGGCARALNLQSRSTQEIYYRRIDLLKARIFARLPGDQQHIPTHTYGWQTQADRFSHHSLDPVTDDSFANPAADRECKAAVWHFIGALYQDQPTIMV